MKSGENIGSMRTKGVNANIILQCTAFHKTLSSCKILSVWVVQLLSFASSTRLRRRRLRFCENYIYEYHTHTASNDIEIFVGVNFYGDIHLDDSRC